MPLRMRLHDREPIGLALRRFKKMLERSGLAREIRFRQSRFRPWAEIRRHKEYTKLRKSRDQTRLDKRAGRQ